MLMRRADPGLPLVSIRADRSARAAGFCRPDKIRVEDPQRLGRPHRRLQRHPATRPAGADLTPPELTRTKIELVNVGFDPRLLTEGKVDVYPVYKSNEPYQIESWGYDLTLWDAADYGVPTLGLAYVTSEDTLANQPEALTRFLRASLKGIRYAADHRDEAVDIVLKYAGPETDREHMRFMLDAELVDAEIGPDQRTRHRLADPGSVAGDGRDADKVQRHENHRPEQSIYYEDIGTGSEIKKSVREASLYASRTFGTRDDSQSWKERFCEICLKIAPFNPAVTVSLKSGGNDHSLR